MTVASAIAKLKEIESKSLARHALTVVDQARGKEWRGIGFFVGETTLVTSMDSVVEVLDLEKCTRVPSSGQWFEGIANVRGQLVPVSDLYSFVFDKPSFRDRNTRMIVFKMASSVTGLIVSSVTGIRSFPQETMDQDYPELDESIKPFVVGCFHRGGEDYPVFDFNRLVANERFMQITEFKE